MFTFFWSVALLLSAITLVPLWRHEAWWVRGFDFPRMQFAIFASLALVAGLLALDLSQPSSWGLLGIIGLCLAYQVWWIIPYTPLFPVEVQPSPPVEPGKRLKILTANVLTPNRNAAGLIALVQEHQPDILVTLESDAWWQSRLEVLEEDYPHSVKCPLDNLYGMHLYSRLELNDSRIEYLVEPDVPSIHTLATLPCGPQVRMHFLHPAPPSPTENETSSERDAELLVVAKNLNDSNEPVIVTGDLNDVAWSDTTRLFRKISGLLDPRVGRGMFNTFHAGYWFLRWPLDHLFHSDHFTLVTLCRLPAFGSDHFPLLTELAYETSSNIEQSGLDADTRDHDWANEKLSNHNADASAVPSPGEPSR